MFSEKLSLFNEISMIPPFSEFYGSFFFERFAAAFHQAGQAVAAVDIERILFAVQTLINPEFDRFFALRKFRHGNLDDRTRSE